MVMQGHPTVTDSGGQSASAVIRMNFLDQAPN